MSAYLGNLGGCFKNWSIPQSFNDRNWRKLYSLKKMITQADAVVAKFDGDGNGKLDYQVA